jgi:hypothetical protein
MADAPSLETFLAAPVEEVACVAPRSLIFAVGGSRRAAALAGVDPLGDAYASYSRGRMMAALDRILGLGVQHIFTPAIRPGQLAEVGRYRARLLTWAAEGLAGPDALVEYAQRGWRVRLLGTDDVPELQEAAARLVAATPTPWQRTVWWYVNVTPESPWTHILAAVQRTGARTWADAVRALYGEDVPLVTMLLSFGKPMFVPDIIPPLLVGDMQCYWYQRPGYEIDERTMRRIFYDYAYLRPTWRADRADRYANLARQRALWETDVVLGVGERVNDFWVPS